MAPVNAVGVVVREVPGSSLHVVDFANFVLTIYLCCPVWNGDGVGGSWPCSRPETEQSRYWYWSWSLHGNRILRAMQYARALIA